VVGNFGGQGLGLVFARRDSATGREMPLEPFERLALAIPTVRDRVATFADYSRADVDRVLGEASQSAIRVGATTFDHLLLLNRGDHFDVRPLPSAAQLAPAFAAVVADFDGDGHEDLFLAQNFSPTATDVQRFDAGAGLLLLGDGRGGFKTLGVRQAGIDVLGDQRGAAAADYDADGRVDLAVSQNGGPTTLWHNRRAAPGIRVRLAGPPENPLAIGAQVRIVTATGSGPVRELHAGSSYWSMDAATTVLAVPEGARGVWVRWPNGGAVTVPITRGQRDVVISSSSAAARSASR
jgi:enediyne biosynthesis protein E4